MRIALTARDKNRAFLWRPTSLGFRDNVIVGDIVTHTLGGMRDAGISQVADLHGRCPARQNLGTAAVGVPVDVEQKIDFTFANAQSDFFVTTFPFKSKKRVLPSLEQIRLNLGTILLRRKYSQRELFAV